MGSGRYMDDPLTFNRNPPSPSSPITVSNHLDSFLGESTSRSGSFESESISEDADFGPEKITGTVEFYERHVFLCYKKPSFWPARIEASEFDRLPRLLSSVASARKSDMKKETLLTICEGHDGTETSNGDVLIFPDMIRYRRLTHFDVDTFVEEVLVKDAKWLPGNPEPLSGSYVFVCCHGSRDKRCGVCGPSLVSRFKEEIELCGLQGEVSVSPCSHVGGHKYTGDVIIYGSNINQRITGNWYGFVTLEDVPQLLEQHIYRGQILDRLWRGEMGLIEEDEKKTQEQTCNDPNFLARQSPNPFQNTLETQPSITSETLPSLDPPQIIDQGHQRVQGVEFSQEEEEPPETRRHAPARAATRRHRPARVTHAPPAATVSTARVPHAPPSTAAPVRRSTRRR